MNTKDQIISESLRLFNDRGEENVGVREIARAIGISPGNLSYHFPRKEDILRYHYQQLAHDLQILIEAYLEEEEDLFRLADLIRQSMLRQYDYRGLFHRPNGLTASAGDNPLQILSGRVVESVTKLGREGQLQMGDEDADFLTGVINFHLRYWLSNSVLEAEAEPLIRKFMLVITKMLLLFASPNGRISLLRFKAGLITPKASANF
jgi:AcrR family transcriptional regulator